MEGKREGEDNRMSACDKRRRKERESKIRQEREKRKGGSK